MVLSAYLVLARGRCQAPSPMVKEHLASNRWHPKTPDAAHRSTVAGCELVRNWFSGGSAGTTGGAEERLLKLIRSHPACVLALRLDVTMRISDEATRGWRVAMGFVRSTTSSSSSRGPHGAALSSQEIMSALAKSADSLAPWDDMVGAWWGVVVHRGVGEACWEGFYFGEVLSNV